MKGLRYKFTTAFVTSCIVNNQAHNKRAESMWSLAHEGLYIVIVKAFCHLDREHQYALP